MDRRFPVLLNAFFAVIARLQRPLIVIELALAATYIAIDVPRDGEIGKTLFPLTVLIFVVAGLLTWQAAVRWRPAALIRRTKPPGFEAPASPVPVLAFTTLLPFVTEQVSTTVDRVAKQINPWWLDILMSALWLLVMAMLARATWSGFGVRLRPEGVVDRSLVGSLFVPWEALAGQIPPVSSRRALVALAYRDPRLVQGFGLGKREGVITALNIDNHFLAGAIQQYVNHPEHRSVIGTEAELHRLNSAHRA